VPPRARVRFGPPLVLTAALLAARAAAAPPLVDAVSGAAANDLHLAVPRLYLLFAPLFTTWDGVSMLGMARLRGFLAGCVLLYLVWRLLHTARHRVGWRRELAVLAVSVLSFAAFVAVGLLWHRPMLALAGASPDDVVVDYHSHTNRSHDVRNTAMRQFDADANRRWHARAGFDAVFLTDHNEIQPPSTDGARHPFLCPGTEVSGWDAHIVLLGPTPPIARDLNRPDGLASLLRVTDSAYGALSIASLPEYERNYWNRLDGLVAAGIDGFEIANAAPKANQMTAARRDTVIALARRTGRSVVGASDSHGWGATSMVWNLVPVRGWQAAGGRPANVSPCAAIIHQLRAHSTSNRVVERHHLRSDAAWPSWLTPIGVLWETWRGMGWPLTASWLAWTWIGALLLSFRRLPPTES